MSSLNIDSEIGKLQFLTQGLFENYLNSDSFIQNSLEYLFLQHLNSSFKKYKDYQSSHSNSNSSDSLLSLIDLNFFFDNDIIKGLFNSIPDNIFIKNTDSVYIVGNKPFLNFLGISSENELTGRTDFSFYKNAQAQKYLEEEKEIIKTGIPSIKQIEPFYEPGNTRWFATSKIPIKNNNGKVIGIFSLSRDITEQKDAEDALMKVTNELEQVNFTLEQKILERTNQLTISEERYKIIIEKTGQLVYDTSDNEQNIKWYGAVEILTGYELSEFSKFSRKNILSFIHPDDISQYIKRQNDARKNFKHYEIEYRFKRKDGHYLYVKDKGVFIDNKDNNTRVIGVLTDISGRKFSETMLRAKERSGRMLMDLVLNTNEAVTVEELINAALNITSTYTNWPIGHAILLSNKFYTTEIPQSFWYTSEPDKYNTFINTQINNKTFNLSLIHQKIINERNATWIRNLEHEKNYSIGPEAFKHGLKSLIIIPVFITGQVVSLIEFFLEKSDLSDEYMFESIEQIGVQLGMIIERRMAEEQLHKLSMAIDQNQSSVIITDSNGIVEYTNPKFSEITGYSFSEIFGQKFGIVKSGKHNNEFYFHLWNTIKEGKIWVGEICNKKKSGQFFWEQVTISPIKNHRNEITHFVAVQTDISEKKQAEEELKIAKEAADTANRAKSEFLANMSHEIRTPMNAILGFTELLISKTSNDQHRNYLESIQSSSKSLLTLINDVLDLSKIDSGHLALNNEIIDPLVLFKDIEYLFQLKAREKSLEFKIETNNTLPPAIEIDEVRFRQILINLISNAIKFTDKGFVKVAVNCIPLKKENVEDYIDIKVTIEDSGIGISPEFMRVIFTPFTQQDGQSTKKYGGTGLGLSIAKRLIDLFEGTISVESEQNKGSKFEVCLKNIRLFKHKIDSFEISTINPAKIKFKPCFILVADDIDNNRKYIKSVLQETNICVIESQNGFETYSLAQVHKPNLIITNIKMPGLDSAELVAKLKSNSELANIPVVATTTSINVKENPKIQAGIFDGLLIKPIQINDIFLELMRLLPYEISSEATYDSQNEDISIYASPDSDLKEVYTILNQEFFDIWKTFETQQPLSEVENFAYKIKELGTEYDLQILISYGNRLIIAINNFDINIMLKALKDFPKLISTFKTIDE